MPERKSLSLTPPKPKLSPVVGIGVGCLVFLIGVAIVAAVAITVSGAIVFSILLGVATVWCGYLTLQKKIPMAYGIPITGACLLLTLTGLGSLKVHQAREAIEQGQIEQGQQEREREEERLAGLRANKESVFALGKTQLAAGDADEALLQFRMVQEVDPNYIGLDAEIEKAQGVLAKQRETQLLGDLKVTEVNEIHKQREIYRELSQLQPENDGYIQRLEQYQQRVFEADRAAVRKRVEVGRKAVPVQKAPPIQKQSKRGAIALGERATISVPGGNPTFGAPSKDVYNAAIDARIANDSVGFKRLPIVALQSGTDVLVIDVALFITRVRVESGTYNGSAFWVASEYIQAK